MDFPDVGIPLLVLLVPYGIFFFFFAVYSLFNIYHLLKFGANTFGAYLLVTIFLGGAVILAGTSASLLMERDWTPAWQPSEILQKADLSGDILSL